MMKARNRSNGGSRLKRAKPANLGNGLARWENEGGAPKSPWVEERIRHAELADGDEDILWRIGAGVIAQWAYLPRDVQRKLFQTAISEGEPSDPVKLKEKIARFLHARAHSVIDAQRD